VITTASSTRCCTRLAELLARLWLACALLVGVVPSALAQSHADVTQLRVERTEDGVVLSAALRFELPSPVEDALSKGIPMFFVAEATLLRERWYWYDKPLAQVQRHMRLSFQPLTRRWRLQVSSQPIGGSGLALGQIFETREEALAAVQRISNWKIADAEVEVDGKQRVEFRFRLDVSQLPRPLQISAVGQSDWNVSVTRDVRLAPELAK